MHKHILTLSAIAALTLAACGGGGGGGGGYGGGGGGGNPPPSSGVGANTIGLALPSSAIGVEPDPTWGSVGGFTQTVRSQVLAFPPGATIKILNLSTSTAHTLNVISASGGPPANFPANPSLSTSASGGATLGMGYASGTINGGGSVTVTLPTTPGTYLLGCAYHYLSNGMRTVIQVSSSAVPGPQATPAPSSGGGGGGGYGP